MELHAARHLYERGVGEVPEPDAGATAHVEDLAKALGLKVRMEQVVVAGPPVGVVLIVEPLCFAEESWSLRLSNGEGLGEEVVLFRGGSGTEAGVPYPLW